MKYYFTFQGNGIEKCILVDYQLSREAIPVSDLLYMMFLCTDHQTRSVHFNEWIDYYHQQLDKSLNYFGMKANYVYPKDLLDADVRRYSKLYFGTAVTIFYHISSFLKKNTVTDDNSNMEEVSAMDSIFKSRVEGLVDTGRQFGLM
jgi:hypothetical protein